MRLARPKPRIPKPNNAITEGSGTVAAAKVKLFPEIVHPIAVSSNPAADTVPEPVKKRLPGFSA